MRMAPGARLPDHQHVKIEQTFVLEGSLCCPEGECHAGQFVWRPAGSRHHAWAGAKGGLFLGIFQLPNKFFEGGRVTDAGGNDWESVWGTSGGQGKSHTPPGAPASARPPAPLVGQTGATPRRSRTRHAEQRKLRSVSAGSSSPADATGPAAR